MNRSKQGFCDHTWNPITGCRHNCPYCYARRMVARFAGDVRLNLMAKKDYSLAPAADGGADIYVLDEPMLNETGNPLVYPFGFAPTLHRYRLNTMDKLKMGNNIFVGAMADVFGAWVPDVWIREVIGACMEYPIHNFLFLTKNPERYMQYGVPVGFENLWYGTSVTKESEIERMNYLPEHCRTFVSAEPLLEDLRLGEHRMELEGLDWIILGAETGKQKRRVIPEWDWIKGIVMEADSMGIPVFMKESLLELVGEGNMRREFPRQLRKSEISEKMKKKLYGNCSVCNSHLKKGEMITLLARSKRGEQPKQFGFMCKDCFRKFCKDLGLDIPELAGLAESITIGPGDGNG